MKIKKYILFLMFLIVSNISTPIMPADHNLAKFEPKQDKVLLIVGQDNETIDNYIKEAKIIPGGFMLYTSIQGMEGLTSPSTDNESSIFYADELIRKYPNTVLQIGLYMVDALTATYQGKYDGNIKILSNWLEKINIPVFLRIGYECDGTHNHYDPEDYKKAYRYLVDKLRAANINNTAYVWHVHSHKTNANIELWYPGNDYVDWVGISYFSQNPKAMEHVIEFARNLYKPVMIAESTPQGIGTLHGKRSWDRWFKRYFRFIDEHKIKAISYINSNWEEQPMWKGQGWCDARIQASSYVKKQWLEETNKNKYIKSYKDLFKLLRYSN